MATRTAEVPAERAPALPARVVYVGLTSNHDRAALLGAVGVRAHRWNVTMRAHLAGLDLDAPPTFPAGN